MKKYLKIGCIILTASSFLFVACKGSKRRINLENIQNGEMLFKSVGCANCHSLSGAKLYGPSLDSILNTEVKVIREGVEHLQIIDRKYIRRSIEKPDFEKLSDFRDKTMPESNLTSHEIDCIIDYLVHVNTN